jgi:hypothetical protein
MPYLTPISVIVLIFLPFTGLLLFTPLPDWCFVLPSPCTNFIFSTPLPILYTSPTHLALFYQQRSQINGILALMAFLC